MATDVNNILAGIGAGGVAGLSLAWFGPTSATAPANATSPLTGFKDAGYCTPAGLTIANATSTTVIQAYGTTAPVRVLTTSEVQTFKIQFMESSTTALEPYHRKAINSITPSASAFSVDDIANTPRMLYSAVFDMVDGTNHIRVYVPSCEVTDKDDVQIASGQAVQYGVTLTAYPVLVGGVQLVTRTFYVVADDVS